MRRAARPCPPSLPECEQSPRCVRTHAGAMRDVAGKLEEKGVVGAASAVVSVAHLTDLCLGLQ